MASVVANHHNCLRFDRRGIDCPFRKARVEEDEEETAKDPESAKDQEEETIKLMAPARREKDKVQDMRQQATADAAEQFIIAHSQREVREALERMRVFQNEGFLPSIPAVGQFQNFLGSQFNDLDPTRIIAIFAAIAISGFLLKQGRLTSPRALSSVLAGETLVASQLRGLGEKSAPDQEFARKMARHVGQVDQVRRLRNAQQIGLGNPFYDPSVEG